MNNPPRPSRILFPVVLLIALAVGFVLVSQSPSSATQAGSRVALQTTPDAVEEAKPTDAPVSEQGTFVAPITGVTPVTTLAVTPVPVDNFDPAFYGIPQMLGGMRVLAVYSDQNTACIPLGYIRLVVIPPDDVYEDLSRLSALLLAADQELASLDVMYTVETYTTVGSDTDREIFLSAHTRNAGLASGKVCSPSPSPWLEEDNTP